jgi:hypothetical protein
MNTFYCKVEDLNGKQYILTDKFKQPLIWEPKSKMCLIINIKKLIDNPALFNKIKETGQSIYVDDTKIPSTLIKNDNDVYVSKPINISEINFNIYDIATFNKDIVIKDKDDKQYTGKEIEQNLFQLFSLDKDNQDYIDKMKQQYGEDAPLDKKVEFFKKKFDYDQQFLTKEEYNNCIISDWTPCKDSTQTRKRTESTKIGKTCTPDQNNLPLTQTCTSSPSETTTETSDNNMYIGIGTIVFFLIVIAFGVYMFKQKNQNQNPYPFPYPNQQFMYR